MKGKPRPEQDVAHRTAVTASQNDGLSRRERPKVITLGDLGDVQNGYDGNNWDWSEWYYWDY